MHSPYRINPKNTNKVTKKLQMVILTTIHTTSLTLIDFKRPQMTSRRPQTKQLKLKRRN